MSNPYQSMIPWQLLKKHFEQQLKATDAMLRRTPEPQASVLRGRACLLEDLLNLPETLMFIAEEDERVLKEKLNAS